MNTPVGETPLSQFLVLTAAGHFVKFTLTLLRFVQPLNISVKQFAASIDDRHISGASVKEVHPWNIY